MNAAIISIGTELVTGQTKDTNAAWLAEQLTRRGVEVVRHVTIGDDQERIATALRHALAAAELVIVTGGLGPTADDLTRQALSMAIDQPLDENADALQQIIRFFEQWQRPMAESNKLQALIPRGCIVIPNSRGTAPGISYRQDHRQLFALPGVPGEMKAMFEATVAPAIGPAIGKACIRSGRLLAFGIGEARVGETLADMMRRGRNPLVGTTASDAVISIRILAHASNEKDAEHLLQVDLAEVRNRLGHVVFGQDDETLEGCVAKLLVQRGLTISTAESCTGGLLSKRLTDIPGSSAYFLRGYVAYSDQAKTDLLAVPRTIISSSGSVSEGVACAMARGCRVAAHSDLAVSITGIAGPTTGIAGPTSGIAGPAGGSPPAKPIGLVYVGLADATKVKVKQLLLGEHLMRDEIRDRACKSALNMLRLSLLGVESS